MAYPGLDIITPTLNGGRFLKACIDSVNPISNFAQHIIVDSGSRDNTLGIVTSAGVKSIYCPPGNMYSAINRGIENTRSEWITYLNSDDTLYPDAIGRALVSVPDNCDIVYGNIDYIDEYGRFLYTWRSSGFQRFAGLFASLIMPFPQPGTLFRRAYWERIGGFDTSLRFSGDFDFFLRAFIAGARFFHYTGMPVASFRLHQDQISQNYKDEMLAETKRSLMVSNLNIKSSTKHVARIAMRLTNIDNYIIRAIRHYQLRRPIKFIGSI